MWESGFFQISSLHPSCTIYYKLWPSVNIRKETFFVTPWKKIDPIIPKAIMPKAFLQNNFDTIFWILPQNGKEEENGEEATDWLPAAVWLCARKKRIFSAKRTFFMENDHLLQTLLAKLLLLPPLFHHAWLSKESSFGKRRNVTGLKWVTGNHDYWMD